jgi:CheY-like chemotaxis protein
VMKALSLPQSERPAQRHAPLWREPYDAPTFSTSRHEHRVLVVEDDPVQAMLLGLMLKHLGVSFHVVNDGAHAIEAVRAGPYALVLMDYLMPGTNGIDATRSIRRWEQDAGLPPTPIVAVTASVMSAECQRYREAGMDDVITKPFSAHTLASLLTRHHPAWPGVQRPAFNHSGVAS